MALADPDISTWQDQIVYLDFDGAEDVIYEGPATVGPFDVPVFAIPMGMAGQENAIISEMLSELYRTVAGTGSVFTTVQPAEGLDYSTIYIGWEWFGLLQSMDCSRGWESWWMWAIRPEATTPVFSMTTSL